jgi:hypothetical protein
VTRRGSVAAIVQEVVNVPMIGGQVS